MAAEPNRHPAGSDDRAKMLRVLIPSVAIAVIVVLVAVLAAVYEDPATTEKDKGGKGKGGYPPPTGGTDVTKLTDGTAPGAEDPQLKEIGGGLKIRDLKVGDGAEVLPGQTVTAYYTGWLTNGKDFDSSRRRGEPISFSLNEVIPGWTKGIPGMKVGGIRKLYIPAELAYGPQGRPGIPPNSTLIFEVEIVDAR